MLAYCLHEEKIVDRSTSVGLWEIYRKIFSISNSELKNWIKAINSWFMNRILFVMKI